MAEKIVNYLWTITCKQTLQAIICCFHRCSNTPEKDGWINFVKCEHFINCMLYVNLKTEIIKLILIIWFKIL